MELVSRPHARNLVRWAAERPEVVVLSADLTASCEADDFRDAYPDRFFSLGMAEQNMISWAGGMAREGFTPFIHTFAVFICRRGYDQLSMSVAYPNLPVRFLGFLPGITTPGGVTHQAIDDLALMRAVPNMTVLECGDATDVETVLDAAQAVEGPVYVRMLRGEVPRLFPAGESVGFEGARGLSRGEDVALITAGICTEEAMRATRTLAGCGVGVSHVHVASIKPLPEEAVLDAVESATRGVIVLENHNVIGGLGSAVAEVMAEAGSGKPLRRLGLPDRYAHGASRSYLMQEYGLDAMAVVRAVEALTNEELGIEPEDLAAVRLPSLHSAAAAEDL